MKRITRMVALLLVALLPTVSLMSCSSAQNEDEPKKPLGTSAVSEETEAKTTKTYPPKKKDWRSTIPYFKTENGSVTDDGIFTEGVYRTRVNGATRAEYDAYLEKLESGGFELYAENVIGDNLYATYTSDLAMVHVYYTAMKNEARILRASMEDFVEYPLSPVTDGTKLATPFVAMTPANGAGFVFRMKDGSYVIIDGGWGYGSDALYRYLKENNWRQDGKILIRAWMITHFHEDHYGNFEAFAQKYSNEVKLEYFVAQLDHPDRPLQKTDCDRINLAYSYFQYAHGTKHIVPQVGQEMYLGEAKFEFLHTQERLYPDYRMKDGNDYSLIAKVSFCNKTLLMMGDGYPAIVGLEEAYGSYLKSDYVQAPHHARGGTWPSFYDLVDADAIFVNATALDLKDGDPEIYGAFQYAINTKRTKYYVTSESFLTIALE